MWKPSKDLSNQLLRLVIQKVEENIREEEDPVDKYKWVIFVTYFVISLRGNDGFMLDL